MMTNLKLTRFYFNEDDPMGGASSFDLGDFEPDPFAQVDSFAHDDIDIDDAGGEFGGEEFEPDESDEEDFGGQYVTREDLQNFAAVLAQHLNPSPYDADPVFDDAPDYDFEVPDSALYDADELREVLDQREARIAQRLEQDYNAKLQTYVAPMMVAQATHAIGDGLNDDAKMYIGQHLAQTDINILPGILQSPEMRNLLRDAAIGHSVRRQGSPVPGASPIASGGGESYASNDLAAVMRAFNVNRKEALKILQG